MTERLDALKSALAQLPLPGAEVASVVPPERLADGSITLPWTDNGQELCAFFRTFNAGAFGFAARDRDYGPALDEWEQAHPYIDPFERESAGLLDRETCLLVLRRVDRAERFGGGSWAGAHRCGLLHALLERLIVLEAKEPSL